MLVFFNPVLKVYFYRFLKKLVFKTLIKIFLKYISWNFAIVKIIFKINKIIILEKFLKKLFKKFLI